jgi:asparagine synthase (glutamine-hydrolysing)
LCGISGALSFGPDAQPIDRTVVSRLNGLLSRRGPDGKGLWSDDLRIVLGHRRLAIIDTTPAADQPMSDETGRWTITFNGEIYNYRELRSELEQLGRVFRTNSDTEVLINAVAQWGEVGLLKLRGMYAFGLWDALQQELWLVRDPYGIKPLYIAESAGVVWFASQARALSRCVPIDFRADPAACVGFQLWGYVPEPFSWWSGIRLLPAGHVQRFRVKHPPAPPREYARIQDAYVNHPAPPLKPGELHGLMMESVRHHLIADVPVGVFLSAGVDSTVIAALATELGAPIATVTLSFDEYVGTPNDEAPMAESVAKILGTDHATIRISRDAFCELLDDFLACMDQPTTDGLNTYLVSYVARKQGLKVALSGLGGDELFGGYPSFRQVPRLVRWGRYLPSSKAMVRRLRRTLPSLGLKGLSPKLAGLLSHSRDLPHAYFLRRALHLEEELDDLLDQQTLNEGLHRLSTISSVAKVVDFLAASEVNDYAQVAALESGWYMRNQLLRDTDWSSMAHGLEVRLPFVDPVVLQRLGPAIASPAPPRKSDLAGCSGKLPTALIERAKTGFTTPVNEWIESATGVSSRGLRGWARHVDAHFRNTPLEPAPHAVAVASA